MNVRAVAAGCPGRVASGGCAAVVDDALGADVWGHGRMSGAWEMFLAPSIGSPHLWTSGLVRLHAYLREDPLGT